MGNRNIKDRVQTAATQLSDSLRNVTDGAVDIKIGGLTIPPSSDSQSKTPSRGAKIQAPAPTPRRNIRMLQEDWSADEDYVRRRVKKRINDRRGLFGHILAYLAVTVVMFGVSPAIQQAMTGLFTSPDFIESVGAATAQALTPLINLPLAAMLALGWGGGVLSHIAQVFYRTGRRQERKRILIHEEMTALYGENWRQTVSDVEYRPIREWVRRRFSRRLGFITHGINALSSTLIVWMLLPILSQLVLNFTTSAFFAQLPSLILLFILGSVLIHGGIVAVAELFDNGHEREIQREIAKEKARLGIGEDEKVKNSILIEKRKHTLEDNWEDESMEMRLTSDGELTESTVQNLAKRTGL
ncbi:MAG TPA: 2TM domain-containing protein [Aggregatilineales bacterium]|nr:2TM domain-containing protein [Aggregatilineales bacterium]